MNKRKCLILFNFFVLITFNINFAHFCIHNINQQLGIIPSAIILITIMGFSFIFQCSFISFLNVSEAFNFGKLIENHFGSLSALIYEIMTVLWLGLCFLSTFSTCDLYLSSILEKTNQNISYYQYVISSGFLVILLLINSCKSTILIHCSIVIAFIIHFINFALFIYLLFTRAISISKKNLITFEKDPLVYYEAFNAFSSVMNTIIILFWVNIKLKKDFNYSAQQSKVVLSINYVFNFVFYAFYIIEGIFEYSEQTNQKHFLLYLLNEKKTKSNPAFLIIHIFISLNILYEIFLTSFYFFVLRKMIFRIQTREFFIGKRYYLYFTPLLLIVLVLSLGLNNPYRIILINNGTFGFIINFIFPCKIYLYYIIP